MLTVGTLDAYYCDAFADILATILLAKSNQSNIRLNDKINSLSLPICTLLSTQNQRSNWKWRMAARGLVEKDNVLSIKKIKDLFKHIMDDKNKILSPDMGEYWLLNKGAKQRLTGITAANYRRLKETDKNKRKRLWFKKLARNFIGLFKGDMTAFIPVTGRKAPSNPSPLLILRKQSKTLIF
jgi:hypothetical protein